MLLRVHMGDSPPVPVRPLRGKLVKWVLCVARRYQSIDAMETAWQHVSLLSLPHARCQLAHAVHWTVQLSWLQCRYDMLCVEGIARALNVFRRRIPTPAYRLADMTGEQGPRMRPGSAAAMQPATWQQGPKDEPEGQQCSGR
jgi:hypothetical protein